MTASPQLALAWRDSYAARARAASLLDVVRDAIKRRGTTKDVASELDGIFGPEGRPVSESVLRAALSPESERNYFRLGLAFDQDFELAFTEQELNANAML